MKIARATRMFIFFSPSMLLGDGPPVIDERIFCATAMAALALAEADAIAWS